MVWYGMVWYDIVLHDMVIRHGTILRNQPWRAIWYNMMSRYMWLWYATVYCIMPRSHYVGGSWASKLAYVLSIIIFILIVFSIVSVFLVLSLLLRLLIWLRLLFLLLLLKSWRPAAECPDWTHFINRGWFSRCRSGKMDPDPGALNFQAHV